MLKREIAELTALTSDGAKPFGELFTAEFMRNVAGFESFEAMLDASGLPESWWDSALDAWESQMWADFVAEHADGSSVDGLVFFAVGVFMADREG